MTVQDIQEVGFEKAVFGGYDMKAVDEFLEKITEEFASLQKENGALKAKMKVLVEKIEEYRSVEEGMRRALMSAQSIAKETVDKANAEAQQIVERARSESEGKVINYRAEVEAEQKALDAARKNTSDFISRVSNIYRAQAEALMQFAKTEKISLVERKQNDTKPLPKKQNEKMSPSVDEQVAKNVSNIMEEQKEKDADAPLDEATRVIPTHPDDEKDFDFGDLKFGTDYDPDQDK